MNAYTLREKELLDKLFQFFSAVEIKDKKQADKFETKESSLSASLYASAKLRNDSFLTYNYDLNSILAALNCSKEMAEMILETKFDILNDIDKDRLKIYMREKIVEEYEEINNYYRYLNGLPDKGEAPLTLSNGKKVTELTNNEIMFTYAEELRELRKKYPKKKYLNRLGELAIDPLFARSSRNFSILYYPQGIFTDEKTKKLIDYYYENLGYVESVVYSKAFLHYDYYNNFITLVLVLMTMQKFIVSQLEDGIKRDFIDEESIKNLFNSYGLPYWAQLPTKYKKRLIKNINKLFMYKGTDKVIVDIVSLLGFENVNIFRHYLVKDSYKDEEGNVQEGLSFVGIPITEPNTQNAIKKSIMVDSYDDMTITDPFWGTNDTEDEIKNKLMEEEFNYISTKYLSINTMYNVTQLTTEVCYFFQLINHLEREKKADLYFYSLDIKPNGDPIRLFDAIVAIYYLVCKKNNFVDQVLTTSTSIASIYGFNFDTDIETLRRILSDNNLSISEEYIKTFSTPPGFLRKKDIVDLYFNNRDFKDKLERSMLECTDITTYKALKKIYSYNMYCENNKSQFKRPDGTYYETYLSYLKDKDRFFADYLEESAKDKDKLLVTLNNVFYALESFLDSEKFKFVFMGLSTISSDVIKKYMKSLIEFFKSYTAELKQMNSFFIIDDRFTNTLKFISDIKLSSNLDIGSLDKNFLDLFEDIYFKIKFDEKEEFKMEDLYMAISKLSKKDRLFIREFLTSITTNREFKDSTEMLDLEYIRNTLKYLDGIKFEEYLRRYINLNKREDLNVKEKLFVDSFSLIIERNLLKLDDVLSLVNLLTYNEKVSVTDFIIHTILLKHKETIGLRENCFLQINENKSYKLIKHEDVFINKNIEVDNRDTLNLLENVSIIKHTEQKNSI